MTEMSTVQGGRVAPSRGGDDCGEAGSAQVRRARRTGRASDAFRQTGRRSADAARGTPTIALLAHMAALAGIVIGVAAAGYVLVPLVVTALNTVSTDDAYVNGHVTFIAPRVAGHVTTVLVDDNQRVKKGDLLVQLDKEPYQVQVDIKKSALVAAKRDWRPRWPRRAAWPAQARSSRFKLDHAMEDVRNQIELLKSNVAQLKVEEANLVLAESDYARGDKLIGKGAISQQEFDRYKAALEVAINRVTSAKQSIQQTRASLGLPINHENPLDMPEDLDESFSKVQEAMAELYGSRHAVGLHSADVDRDADSSSRRRFTRRIRTRIWTESSSG